MSSNTHRFPSRDRDADQPAGGVRRHHLYLLSVVIFISSRFVVALAIDFATIYLPAWKSDLWQPTGSWYRHLLRWDSEWYAGIAADGYDYNGNPNDYQAVVFYPLYPLISRFVATLLHVDIADGLLIVSNIAGFLGVLLVFKLVQEEFGNQLALGTVTCLSFFPTSLFLSGGYSEPLALVLILCCFLMLRKQCYLLAATFAGLALATRSTGIALLPAILWELVHGSKANYKPLYVLLCILLATSGLWIYATYLAFAFGHPMAFAEAQAAWHGTDGFISRLVSALKLQPFLRLRLDDPSPAGFDGWFFVLFLLLIPLAWRRLPASMVIFMVGALLLPYLSLSGGPAGFTSMARFGLLAFPAFVVMAEVCQRAAWLGLVLVGIFSAMLFMYSALFAQWYWVG